MQAAHHTAAINCKLGRGEDELLGDQTQHQNGGNLTSVNSTGCWWCQMGWSDYLQKLLINWDFHAEPSLWWKKKKEIILRVKVLREKYVDAGGGRGERPAGVQDDMTGTQITSRYKLSYADDWMRNISELPADGLQQRRSTLRATPRAKQRPGLSKVGGKRKKVLVLQPRSVPATEGIKPSAGALNLIKRPLSVYAQR